MLNQPVALEDLDGVILDFGGVLYDIDYDAPPAAFAKLGDSDFASLYHQASQSPWFDDLETGRLDKDNFYGHLARRCTPGTTHAQIHHAWCCILTGMPVARARLVKALGRSTRLFLLSNTNAIHAAVFEEDLRRTLPDAEAFWAAWTELGPLNIDLMAPTSVFCSALLVDPVRFRFSLITIGRVLLAWTSSHKMSRESGAGEHPSGYLLPSAR